MPFVEDRYKQQNIYSVVFPETYFFCRSHPQHLTKGVNGRKKSTVFSNNSRIITLSFSRKRAESDFFCRSHLHHRTNQATIRYFKIATMVQVWVPEKKIHCFSINSRIFTLSFSGKTAETYFFLPFTPAPSYEISKFRFVPFFSALSWRELFLLSRTWYSPLLHPPYNGRHGCRVWWRNCWSRNWIHDQGAVPTYKLHNYILRKIVKTCIVTAFNLCPKCAGRPGILHDRMPDCHSDAWA